MNHEGQDEPSYMAKLAEQTERYDDMVNFMKRYIDEKREINEEARNLLSISYKNVVGNKRTAWRAVSNLEQKEKEKKSKYIDCVKWYRMLIEHELQEKCREVLV